jgi:hypothetical protein
VSSSLVISKNSSRPLRLRLDSHAMSPGYDNKTPVTLPFSTESWSIKAFAFSPRSNQLKRMSWTFEADWRVWMDELFPDLEHFADHHAWFWQRVWDIEPGVRPSPTVALWARGGAKSSSAEMACVALGVSTHFMSPARSRRLTNTLTLSRPCLSRP